MYNRGSLFCEHVVESGYKIPQLRLATLEGNKPGHKYVCRDCFLTATAGHISTRPHKDFVTKRFAKVLASPRHERLMELNHE